MQTLAPANGTEVANYTASPSASVFDIFVNDVAGEGHQVLDALRVQVAQTPAPQETLDNTPAFAPPGMSGPRR